MAEQKESSVLFSLKELMNLEQERIAQEAANQQRQAREARERREAEERALREAEERRLREADEVRRAAEQRQREEAARVEAIKQAELERAKSEAEHRAKLAAVAAQHEHEAQLTKIRQQSSARKVKVGASIAITILAFMIAGLVFKWKQDQERAAYEQDVAAKALAQAKEEQQRLAEEQKKLQQQIADAEKEHQRIEEALRNAKTEADRRRLIDEKNQNEEKVRRLEGDSRGGGGRPSRAKPSNKPACNCTPGDPLCSCL
jgi:colicin import membrane protein